MLGEGNQAKSRPSFTMHLHLERHGVFGDISSLNLSLFFVSNALMDIDLLCFADISLSRHSLSAVCTCPVHTQFCASEDFNHSSAKRNAGIERGSILCTPHLVAKASHGDCAAGGVCRSADHNSNLIIRNKVGNTRL
jgi:hypothetical protein